MVKDFFLKNEETRHKLTIILKIKTDILTHHLILVIFVIK